MMNETQEQIKKLKSCKIWMEQCIYVEREREKCRKMWIDEMVMELGVMVKNVWESSQEYAWIYRTQND